MGINARKKIKIFSSLFFRLIEGISNLCGMVVVWHLCFLYVWVEFGVCLQLRRLETLGYLKLSNKAYCKCVGCFMLYLMYMNTKIVWSGLVFTSKLALSQYFLFFLFLQAATAIVWKEPQCMTCSWSFVYIGCCPEMWLWIDIENTLYQFMVSVGFFLYVCIFYYSFLHFYCCQCFLLYITNNKFCCFCRFLFFFFAGMDLHFFY